MGGFRMLNKVNENFQAERLDNGLVISYEKLCPTSAYVQSSC